MRSSSVTQAALSTAHTANKDVSESCEETKFADLEDAELHSNHLTGLKLVTVVASLALAVFCVALDNTILATAVPRITDTFHSVDDVGWYASSYLLTLCSFQILYARFYAVFTVKRVFLAALALFEIGSLVCGVAPTSSALIVGRAVAGLGAAGIFTGATTAIAQVSPVRKRPLLIALITSLFGICAVVGPLIGGALTDNATWRWCFYLNLPIGGVAAVGVLTFLRVEHKLEKLEGTLFKKIRSFDPVGNALFVCFVVCLLLALQWGGTTYAWSNGRIIALFVLAGVLLVAFVSVEAYLGENATIPPRVIKRRTIQFGCLYAFMVGTTVFIVIYYLPVFFQVIQGVDAITSAIHTLPMILAQLFATIFSGALTQRIGYYMQWIYAACILMPIGTGLLTTFRVGEPIGNWIGYEIIAGLGFGFGFQQSLVAAQTAVPLEDVAVASAVVFSSLFFGGSLFLLVAENVFTNHLQAGVAALHIPGLDPAAIITVGATEVRGLVSAAELPELLAVYNSSITKAFQVALITACLASLGAAGMEWLNVKKPKRAAAAPCRS